MSLLDRVIADHLAVLAGQDAMTRRDQGIRELVGASECTTCRGIGKDPISPRCYNPDCRDCSGTGTAPKPAAIARAISQASPPGRGLSRQRIKQISEKAKAGVSPPNG